MSIEDGADGTTSGGGKRFQRFSGPSAEPLEPPPQGLPYMD